MTGERSFDEGLQLERTALAWQRTLLALAVAFLLAGRGLLGAIGPWSYLVGGVGLALTLALAVLVWRRYRREHVGLTSGRSRMAGGALLIIGCAAITLVCGMGAFAFVLGGR